VDQDQQLAFWEELAERREQLLPELQICLIETPVGTMLDHPYVREYRIDQERAAMLNWRYREKLKKVELALWNGDWSQFIYLHERPYRLDALLEIVNDVRDKEYWSLLSDVWTDSENIWQDLEQWRDLWNEPRPYKHYAMDAKERKAFKQLPSDITIYRGFCEGHTADGMSWTLDRDRAIWFAKRRLHSELRGVLLSARTMKSNVHALLLGREESEIVTDQFEIIATAYLAEQMVGSPGVSAGLAVLK
jgi:DNA-binding ferritin-like protein (Dps family)